MKTPSFGSHCPRFLAIVLLSCVVFATSTRAAQAQAPMHPADRVNWKLLFNQLFALEIKKEVAPSGQSRQTQTASQLREFTHYTDTTFNETLDHVLRARTSDEAYELRRGLYENGSNYEKISNLDFSMSMAEDVRRLPAVSKYLATLQQHASRSIQPAENFFHTKEGLAFLSAISFGALGAGSQEVALVLIPGYAAHAIKFGIFPEIVRDANLAWGRPESRPLRSERYGMDFDFEDATTYYMRGASGNLPFDIIGPAGLEMGNTVGFNAETADLMAQWIENLPERYRSKKLVLLGYSKGAPVIFEMMARHPGLKSRIVGVITFDGVVQGTHIARKMQHEIQGHLGDRTVSALIDSVRKKGTEDTLHALAPVLSQTNLGFVKLPKIREVLSIFDVDTSEWEATTDRMLDGREVREVLDGANDLSPYTRTLWNLRNFDENLFAQDTFVFNMSAITDIKTFVRPAGFDSAGHRRPSLIWPTLNAEGHINWKDFSLDALFLYTSSVEGFKMAPGGLYDTQVELQHTKTPWLDRSPLSASLTDDEMRNLWALDDVRAGLHQRGISTLLQFYSTPRSELVSPAFREQVRAYDLGEYKGHHWSLFHQAFRPPETESREFAVWNYPRKAFMRAMLQTVALYNLVNQERCFPSCR